MQPAAGVYLYPPFDVYPNSATLVVSNDVIGGGLDAAFKIRVLQSRNLRVRVSPKEGIVTWKGQAGISVTLDPVREKGTLQNIREGKENFKVICVVVCFKKNFV